MLRGRRVQWLVAKRGDGGQNIMAIPTSRMNKEVRLTEGGK